MQPPPRCVDLEPDEISGLADVRSQEARSQESGARDATPKKSLPSLCARLKRIRNCQIKDSLCAQRTPPTCRKGSPLATRVCARQGERSSIAITFSTRGMGYTNSAALVVAILSSTHSASGTSCAANFRESVACCGQHDAGSIPVSLQCPFSKPVCVGYDASVPTFGTCQSLGPFGEMGLAQTDINWKTHTLQRSYSNPVVIMGVTNKGMNEATYLVKDVTANSFKFRCVESPTMDNNHHILEDFHYLVLEAGNHYMSDGTQISAGKVPLSQLGAPVQTSSSPVPNIRNSMQCTGAGGNSYAKCSDTGMHYCCTACNGYATCPSNSGLGSCACTGRTFPFPKAFKDPPVLLTSLQRSTHNKYLTPRIKEATRTTFTAGMQRHDAADSGYLTEGDTLGWVAFEKKTQFGLGGVNGKYGGGITNSLIAPVCPTSKCELGTESSCNSYGFLNWGWSPGVPRFAIVQTFGIRDAAQCSTRYSVPSSMGTYVCVQADTTFNTARVHMSEKVAWLVREAPGFLYEGITPSLSPTTFSPVTGAPVTISPTTQMPTTASPATGAPTTLNPTTEGPTTASPATIAPTSLSPTTQGPTSQSPTTCAPTSLSPTTQGPTSQGPTTCGPTSQGPTTQSPATSGPTMSPTTEGPTTCGPTSQSPTSESPTSASPTLSPTTEGPTTVSPTSQSPTSESPATASPRTASPATDSPTTGSPATAAPSESPTSRSPVIGSLSPLTSTPTSLAPLTGGRTHSPATATPSVNPTINPTANPTKTPTTESPATVAPSESPTTESPATIAPSESPATAGPTASPATVAPTGSPATQSPATVGPTASPVTSVPTVGWTPSPTQYSATCSPLAATLRELKAVLPTTNGTDGVCGQMNRGLTSLIDTAQYTRALNTINNSTARVAALQSAPESCSAYLDFQCDANDNVATTVQRLDTYMKAAFYRLQTLVASGGGNRNGLSLVQTMIQIVKTTALTQAERNDFSESAGNFTEGANATDLAQTTYGQDIADLLAALIDKNAETAEGESAPMSSNACAAVAKAFERVERLLHKAGTVLSVGGSARRLDTSMFESWSSRVDATGRGQLQPSGATLGLPQFSYQVNSAATAGDIVVLVALRWKNRVDLCRKPGDLTLESDIYTVSALGDASRMADDVYFATGETIDMSFTARTSSSRAAQRTTGCSGPKECRWWNTATQAWDSSGCTYSETTESCSCTHLTDFAVVAPVVACPEAESGGGASSSGASVIIFVLIPILVVALGVVGFFLYKRHSRGKARHTKIASVVPSMRGTKVDEERGEGSGVKIFAGPDSDADLLGSARGSGGSGADSKGDAEAAAPGLAVAGLGESMGDNEIDNAALFNSTLPGSVPTSARGSEAAPIVFPQDEAGLGAPASPEAMLADANGPMMVYDDSSSSDMSDVNSDMVQDLFQQVDQRIADGNERLDGELAAAAVDAGAGGEGVEADGLEAARAALDAETTSSEEVEPMVPLAPFGAMEAFDEKADAGASESSEAEPDMLAQVDTGATETVADEPAIDAAEPASDAESASEAEPTVGPAVLEEPAAVAEPAEESESASEDEPAVAPAVELVADPVIESVMEPAAEPAIEPEPEVDGSDLLGVGAGGSLEDQVNAFFDFGNEGGSDVSTSSDEA